MNRLAEPSWCLVAAIVVLSMSSVSLARQHQRRAAEGLVLRVDIEHKVMVVSCKAIPGYMDAMTMAIAVPDAKQLASVHSGTMIDFILVSEGDSAHAESVRVHVYQGLEPDPLAARRLNLLAKVSSPPPVKALSIGDLVPDFTLTNQDGRAVSFSAFRGKIVVLDFIYTRCALPNFCLRSSNNFGALEKRFHDALGRDMVLLTVTFDPVHDSPDALKKYAQKWHAESNRWHFLTGSEAEIRRVCALFGEDYFPDEGVMDHSLHTAIMDRDGRLITNLEGNEFTAQELSDLVETILPANTRSTR